MSPDGPRPASRSRDDILEQLKANGVMTAAALAAAVGITTQGVGQQLAALRAEGLVASTLAPSDGREGRPGQRYRLTEAGEHAFPKAYDALASLLVEAVAGELGPEALTRVLAAATDARAAPLLPLVRDLPLRERLEVVRRLYRAEDPHLDIREVADGFLISERNCPFLRVAMRHPQLCSTSVSLLVRLLGVRVARERRFQDGDGCCVFHVYADQPVPASAERFGPEPARDGGASGG